MEWYRTTAKDALKAQDVSVEQGLEAAEAKARLERVGPNALAAGKKLNPLKLFAGQFKDVLILVLLAAAIVSFGLSFLGPHNSSKACAEVSDTACDPRLVEELARACGEMSGLPLAAEWPQCVELASLNDGEITAKDIRTVSVPAAPANEDEGVIEAALIFGIVIAIAVIGFLNEYKAEKTVEALRKLVGHKARVRRGGDELEIDAAELVPGDIILLEEGQKVPADIRLLTVRALQANEASLTGESLPVSKREDVIKDRSALGDQRNMLFSGTLVTTGTGVGLVVATGAQTELGKIAHLVTEVEADLTPMQRKLDDLGRRLGQLILGICLLVFVVVFFVDQAIMAMPVVERMVFAFTVAVALAVAAIPEGLSFVVRISLALGARRMAAKDALVRKLSAVEALGSTDVICSDKTGTLTRGEMTVRQLWLDGATYEVTGSGYGLEGGFSTDGKQLKDTKSLERLLSIGSLVNNAKLNGGQVLGDPTEAALIVAADKAGQTQAKLHKAYPRVDEVPFTSERKLMSTVHKDGDGYLVANKGAVDVMLDLCDTILIGGKPVAFTAKRKEEVLAANSAMAKQALRVLGFAYKEEKKQPKGSAIETGLTFLGLQGMMDPPRDEVKEVIRRVQAEASMRVIMITGDYVDTAEAVAREIGIEGAAISGQELDQLSQAQFEAKVEEIGVYARVNPEHKIRIVQALKKHGHQVAMTGDGVNDAPAIKAADIGIAMGITGTDASKEAADLILLDDQFLTIIDAIQEGRGIFDNVRKFVAYLLGANIAEVLLVLGGIIIFKDPVLTATQLLFINIVTDGLPAVALGSDPAEDGIMRFKSRHFQEAIVNKRVWIEMVVFGLVTSALLLGHFWYAHAHEAPVAAVSSVFTALVLYELVRLVVLRTNYHIKWFANPWLTVALVSSFALQVAVLYITPLAKLFGVGPVRALDWWIMAAGSVIVFVVMKVTRWLLNRHLPEARHAQVQAS